MVGRGRYAARGRASTRSARCWRRWASPSTPPTTRARTSPRFAAAHERRPLPAAAVVGAGAPAQLAVPLTAAAERADPARSCWLTADGTTLALPPLGATPCARERRPCRRRTADRAGAARPCRRCRPGGIGCSVAGPPGNRLHADRHAGPLPLAAAAGRRRPSLRRRRAALCAAPRRRRRHRRLHHARRARRRCRGRGRRHRRPQSAARAVPGRPRTGESLPAVGPALPRAADHRRRPRFPNSQASETARASSPATPPRSRRCARSRRSTTPASGGSRTRSCTPATRPSSAAIRPMRGCGSSTRFVAAGGEALRDFAVFAALSESTPACRGGAGRSSCSSPSGPAVRAFAREHAPRVRFHLYLQWIADRAARRGGASARAPPASRWASIATSRSAPRPTVRKPGRSRRCSRAAPRWARRPIRSRRPGRTGAFRRRYRTRCRPPATRRTRRCSPPTCGTRAALRIDHVMGLAAAVLDSRGCRAGRRRLRPLSGRRSRRRAGRGERARALLRRRRGPRHGPRGACASGSTPPPSSPTGCCGSSATARPSCRPRATRATPPPAPRPTTCRRSAAGGPAPTSPSGSASACSTADATRTALAERERERAALRQAFATAEGRPLPDASDPPATKPSASSPPRTATSPRRRRRWCCCRPTTSPARPTRSTCRAPTASGRTGGARSGCRAASLWQGPIGRAARRDLAAAGRSDTPDP